MSLLVSHHLLLCSNSTKANCCNASEGMASWEKLKNLIKTLDLENPQRPEGVILRSKVDCLRICKDGPILLIWPDGIWYGQVTPERIDVIVREHVLGGNPLHKWIIRRTPLA